MYLRLEAEGIHPIFRTDKSVCKQLTSVVLGYFSFILKHLLFIILNCWFLVLGIYAQITGLMHAMHKWKLTTGERSLW
jgi:hypothetical protein